MVIYEDSAATTPRRPGDDREFHDRDRSHWRDDHPTVLSAGLTASIVFIVLVVFYLRSLARLSTARELDPMKSGLPPRRPKHRSAPKLGRDMLALVMEQFYSIFISIVVAVDTVLGVALSCDRRLHHHGGWVRQPDQPLSG